MRKLAFLTVSALMLFLSCDCDGSEPAFGIEYPMNTGDAWYYREVADSAANYQDTVLNIGDTTYQGILACLLFSTHAKDTAKQETTTAFYRGDDGHGIDTLYHFSRTTGFFPDTINYGGHAWFITFDHPNMEIAWIPRKLDLGDEWPVATDEGWIVSDSGDQYHLKVSVNAVFDSIQSLSFNDTIYGFGQLDYPNCSRVVYTGNFEFQGLPFSLVISRSWWRDGVGPVKHWAYATDTTGAFDPLEEYLLDYTGDN